MNQCQCPGTDDILIRVVRVVDRCLCEVGSEVLVKCRTHQTDVLLIVPSIHA